LVGHVEEALKILPQKVRGEIGHALLKKDGAPRPHF
jgi:hypothetical protein